MNCKNRFWILVLVFMVIIVIQGCGNSNDGGSTTNSSSNSTLSATLSGTATSTVSGKTGQNGLSNHYAPVSAGTVTLYKMKADGTEEQVDIGTVTTNSAGEYSIPNVTLPTTDTGASTDFYYQVRVADGTNDIRAPAAPTGDETVNVSPQTNLAANVLASVVDVPNLTTDPTPSADIIGDLRELVTKNVSDLSSEISVPNPTTSNASETVGLANGIAAAGGNGEKMYKAVQFESEYRGIVSASSPSSSDASSYIYRMAQESCDRSGSSNITESAADALAAAMIAGTTYTAGDVVTAFNANNGSGTDIDSTTAITAYASRLSELDTIFGAVSSAITDITTAQQVALYSKRDLTGAAFSSSSALAPDQALALILTFSSTDCSFSNMDITAIVAGLTSSSTLAAPLVSDTIIYHNSGFGCDSGANQLHFMADIKVFIPIASALTVTSVVVTSTDTTALGGDGTETLTLQGNRYTSDTTGICVAKDTQVTYTVTVTFSDSSTKTRTAIRTHPDVPESEATRGGTSLSGDSNNPTIVPIGRPLIAWTNPVTQLTTLRSNNPNTDAAITAGNISGARIKYTYEFAHFQSGGGGPLNSDTYSGCRTVSSGQLYSVARFLPRIRCHIDNCAASVGVATSEIMCRTNIQTYFVDGNDNILGQAAGNFRFFCVDPNVDGDCGT